ncbi:MAG: hypothetical protein CBC04_01560 [Verrucomicrobia bacterium TMED44]|nr:MAG: hypothetical protein CBC04_01560 [Verrucomicrobia bacterium TMED44]
MNTIHAHSMVVGSINKQASNINAISKALSSGSKSSVPTNDLGALSAVARNKQALANLIEARQNIQSNMSFLQTQDSAMVKIGDIISRCAELKTSYLSPVLSDTDKDAYNKEFRSLQLELREMKELKFNGVSLFAHEADPTLINAAEDPNDINGYDRGGSGVIRIERTGIFDDLKKLSDIPVESGSSNAAGGPNEFRDSINLQNYSGKLTFWQWPYGVPDNFRVYHGSSLIHDQTYGNLGQTKEMNDGRLITPATNSPASPGDLTRNKDVISFGQSGNRSMTMELVMNESGFKSGGTSWSMAYSIEYDPIMLDLSGPATIWTLDDYDLEDFEGFLTIVSSARAQNGASYKELENLNAQYEDTLIGLEQYGSNLDDLDISKSITELKKSEANLALNFHFIDQVAQIDTVLIDDFLQK